MPMRYKYQKRNHLGALSDKRVVNKKFVFTVPEKLFVLEIYASIVKFNLLCFEWKNSCMPSAKNEKN